MQGNQKQRRYQDLSSTHLATFTGRAKSDMNRTDGETEAKASEEASITLKFDEMSTKLLGAMEAFFRDLKSLLEKEHRMNASIRPTTRDIYDGQIKRATQDQTIRPLDIAQALERSANLPKYLSNPTSRRSSDMYESDGYESPDDQESDEDNDYSSSNSSQSSAAGAGPRRNDKGKLVGKNGSTRPDKREATGHSKSYFSYNGRR